ncbi:hypothetical protein GCM10009599_21860 [Luteococcus peritonei]
MLGLAVGCWVVGPAVGFEVVGSVVGFDVVGACVGFAVVGAAVGFEVVGRWVGLAVVGRWVGLAVVGRCVGFDVVGAAVGRWVGAEVRAVVARGAAVVGTEVVGTTAGRLGAAAVAAGAAVVAAGAAVVAAGADDGAASSALWLAVAVALACGAPGSVAGPAGCWSGAARVRSALTVAWPTGPAGTPPELAGAVAAGLPEGAEARLLAVPVLPPTAGPVTTGLSARSLDDWCTGATTFTTVEVATAATNRNDPVRAKLMGSTPLGPSGGRRQWGPASGLSEILSEPEEGLKVG